MSLAPAMAASASAITPAANATISAVLYYGDRCFNLGTVNVTNPLDLAAFKTNVGRTFNIPPHELTVSLVRRRRREHIDEFTDFSAVAIEGQSTLLVEMRKTETVTMTRNREVRVNVWDYERYVMMNRPPALSRTETPVNVECKWCVEGRDVEFHPCVHDKVVVAFRSMAGPVERPEKEKHATTAEPVERPEKKKHLVEGTFNWDPISDYKLL